MPLKDSPAQSSVQDGDDQDISQLVLLGAIDGRIGQVLEAFAQTEFGMILHPHFES